MPSNPGISRLAEVRPVAACTPEIALSVAKRVAPEDEGFDPIRTCTLADEPVMPKRRHRRANRGRFQK